MQTTTYNIQCGDATAVSELQKAVDRSVNTND